LDYLLKQLEIFSKFTVYLFFSPEREKYKSKIKTISLYKLDNMIKKKYANVHFFNNYQIKFGDSLFADCTHFNNIGATKYSILISEQILSNQNNGNRVDFPPVVHKIRNTF